MAPTTQTPETMEREHAALSTHDSPKPAGGGMLRKLIVLVVILGVVGAVVWKIHQNNAETKAAATKGAAAGGDRAIPVTTALVQQKTMPIYLTALGTVTAYYSVTVKSRVDGQLLSVNVREGQSVRKGQVLAEIDPSPYRAALAQAEGQLAKDQATADYAHVESQRYEDLYKAGVVSKDSAQTQASTAGQSAGAIQADKAAIEAAKVNVAYTRIVSPIDGVVGLRQVDPGNIVHAADTTGLMVVNQLQPISVIFTLPEDQLPQVQTTMLKGARLPVEAYDRSETTHLATGSLVTLDNQIDTTTGTDKVKAVFDNKDNSLFPNQFVNVRLILQQRPDTIVIPAAAVQTGTNGNFVFVAKEGAGGKSGKGKSAAADASAAPAPAAPAAGGDATPAPKGPKYHVEIRPIVIDLTEGTNVIIKSGLAAGEQVVIDGQEKLKDGSSVAPKLAGKSGKGEKGAAPAASDAPDTAAPAGGKGKGGKKGQPS